MLNEIESQNIPIVPGSEQDIYNRLIQQLPADWFGSNHRVLDIILAAYVNTTVWIYQQSQYVGLQARLQTATDNNLDLFARDYFGDSLPRHEDENDNTYRKRISANLLQEKSTRFGMENALFLLTGYYPRLFEPWNPYDCGAYNVAFSMGYSTHGNYGSGSFPYQGFIDVFVDAYFGLGNYSGYNNYYGGYSTAGGLAQLWYGGSSAITSTVTDNDIYNIVTRTKVWGTICWVRINRI
jgi:hypothetical protein